MAWFKLKATSHVELSHLLFSEAHRPCLKALRGEIRGFLISIWETYVCLSSQFQSVKKGEVEPAEGRIHVFIQFTWVHIHLFMCAHGEYRVGEGKEVSWLLGGKLLKRLEPGTPS